MIGRHARRGLRFGWRLALSVALALILVLLFSFADDAREWVYRIWFQISHLPPRSLALALAFKVLESLLIALAWRNILRGVFPAQRVSFRQAFGAYQGSVAIGVLTPGQTATIALLGLLRLAIPGAAIATLLASTVVQEIGFLLLGLISWGLLALAYPAIVSQSEAVMLNAFGTLGAHQQLALATVVGAILIALVVALTLRRRVRAWREQLRPAAAILQQPRQYVVGVLLPEFASYGSRWVVAGVMLAAFGIPVTPKSLLLAVAARSVSGSLAVTPGGVGTATLLSVVVLQPWADSWTIVAWSISLDVLLAATNIVLGLVAITWGLGWSHALGFLRHPLGHAARQRQASPATDSFNSTASGSGATD